MIKKFVNKWVSTYRHPTAGRPIGRVKCIFVFSETLKQVAGTESGHSEGTRLQFGKDEVIRIIEESEVTLIRRNQMDMFKAYNEKHNKLLIKFRKKMKKCGV